MRRYLHPELEPLAFELRGQPGDFQVTELRATPPSGEGEHLHLFVEAEGLTTDQTVRALGRALGRPARAFGHCGRKDKSAVTRQWISVQGGDPERLERLHSTRLSIKEWAMDRSKLRLGAHGGNRFAVLLRGLQRSAEPAIQRVLETAHSGGLPNFFGAQRYGFGGINPSLGAALLAGDGPGYVRLFVSDEHLGPATNAQREACAGLRDALSSESKSAWRAAADLAPDLPARAALLAKQMERRPLDTDSLLRSIPKADRRLHANSLQSALFDRWLGLRMELADWPKTMEGDCLGNAGQRDHHIAPGAGLLPGPEVGILGPLFGASMSRSAGAALELEQSILRSTGLDFSEGATRDGHQPRGGRRAMVVALQDPEVEWTAEGPWIRFGLPPGSYATALTSQWRKDFQDPALGEPR